MRLESLKKGFWGYKRDAVFQYITEQEELFSQKMAEKDAQLDRAGQQAQARIQELERELLELARYREKVAALRETIQATLTGLEQHAEELEQQAEELYEAAPTGNLTLFQ